MRSLLTRTATGLCLIVVLFISLQFPLLFAGIVIAGCFYLFSIELPHLLKRQSFIIRLITMYSIVSAAFWLVRQAMSDNSQSRSDLLLVLLSAIVFDTVSYFVGSALGKRKIAPKITPGKTWEGFLGGMIGLLAFISVWVGFNWQLALFYTLTLGLGAFFGDLYESWLKRKAGVKDSSALFPGHGGLYDRIDSLIGAIFIFSLIKRFVLYINISA